VSLDLDAVLAALLERRGSDLHLKSGRPPLFRLGGTLMPSEYPIVDPVELQSMLNGMMSEPMRQRLAIDRAVDFSIAFGHRARFRVNAYYQRAQLQAILRAVPLRVPTLDQLKLPEVVEDIALSRDGLVLVTGPTGSGKSTTLAAMMEHINRRRQVHIVTLEDPIEFVYEDAEASVSQREIGFDTPSFAEGLRQVLRQDPDVILVGEMRDPETVATALTAAETGHLVCSTVHANDAPQTVDRILDTFPGHQHDQVRLQLAKVLRAVISQRLVPMAARSGRVAAVELMTGSPPVAALIAEGNTGALHRVIEESAAGMYRMQTLNQGLVMLVIKGTITESTAEMTSPDRDEFQRLLRVGKAEAMAT